MTLIGEIAAVFRYPVKSMRGERVGSVEAAWHGLTGDRRLGLRRTLDRGGFPWLTASKLPELLLHVPERDRDRPTDDLPAVVRTPDGETLPVFGPALAEAIGRRHGSPVEMVHLDRGIFDAAAVSIITEATVDAVCRRAALPTDVRRFRPNIVIATPGPTAFDEDRWVGGILSFGDARTGAAVFVTTLDERCAMVNYDPDSAQADPEMLRTIVRERGNTAGVYGAVVRCGPLAAGQPVFFEHATGKPRS